MIGSSKFAAGKSGSSGGGETMFASFKKKEKFYSQNDGNEQQAEEEQEADDSAEFKQQKQQESSFSSFPAKRKQQKEWSASSSSSSKFMSKNYFISLLTSSLDYFSSFSHAFFNTGYAWWQRYLAPYFSFYQFFWLTFGGGGFLLFQYLFVGFISLFTVIGIPFSFNTFRLAFYGLKPTFEIDGTESHSTWNRVKNTVWFFSLGWMFSLTNIFFAIFLTIFPFSRSFAQDHLRLLELNVAPFGKKLCYGGIESGSNTGNNIQSNIGGGAGTTSSLKSDTTALPWKTQEAKNMQLLVQEEMGVIEQRFNEKSLSGNTVSMQLDETFDKYYKSSNWVQEGARTDLKQKLQKKLDKRLQYWDDGFAQIDENVRQIRVQVEQIIESNFNELRADMETVRGELKNANEAHKKALEDVTMLQQEADRFRAFEQRLYEAQEKNTNDTEKYEQQIQYLQQSIEKEVSRTRQFEEQAMQLKQQYQQAQSQFDNLKRENEKLRGEWKQQDQELNRLKVTQAQVEKMRGERDSLAQELLKFQDAQVRNLNSFNEQISHLQGKLKRVEEELGIAKNALYSSQNDREKDRETIKQMKKKFELLSSLEEERNRLQSQLDSLKEDMSRMERESKHQILSVEQHYQSELKGLQKWREERIKVQEELNDLRKNKLNQDELINQRNLFQKELEVVQANYKRLQEDVALISQSRDETEEKNRALLKDFNKLNATLSKQASQKIVVETNTENQLARESVSSSMSKS